MSLEEILSGSNGSTSTDLPSLTSSISDMLAPFIWLSVALTVVFVVFYVISQLRRRKLENALFDMQKTLHELNERDKARSQPAPTPERPRSISEKDRVIASSDSANNTV